MNESEHLTENQLAEYFGGALERGVKHAVGRHLLQCDFCLKRLPQPTPEQFMAALMTDNEYEVDSLDEKTALATLLNSISDSLKQPKILVFGAVGALSVCLLFTAFFWINAAQSSLAEREVAESFEVKETQTVPTLNGDSQNMSPTLSSANDGDGNSSPSQKVKSKLPVSGNDKDGNGSSSRNVSGQSLPVATNVQPKTVSKIDIRKSDTSTAPKTSVSSTRGGAESLPKCSDLQPLDLATGMNNEAILLKWKKVPNAAKYHIYVSDDDEILVDEFETEQETSYALKKPLAPEKTYQWKVVVTLEDGKTIIGDSQKFTIKDLQSNQKKPGGKVSSIVRCSEGKFNR